MRTIKLMCVTTLLLLALAGVGSFLATHWLDAKTGSGNLFALAWVFAGIGIVSSAVLVGSAPSWKEFGTPKMLGELFGCFAVAVVIAAFVLLIFGGMIYAVVVDFGTGGWDSYVYVTFIVACLAGQVMSFFTHLATVVDESWVGQTDANLRQLRRVG